jgi:hypothetical protein
MKIVFKEISWENMNFIDLVRDGYPSLAVVNTVMNILVYVIRRIS